MKMKFLAVMATVLLALVVFGAVQPVPSLYPYGSDTELELEWKKTTSLAWLNTNWMPVAYVGVQPVPSLYPYGSDTRLELLRKQATALAYMATNGAASTGSGTTGMKTNQFTTNTVGSAVTGAVTFGGDVTVQGTLMRRRLPARRGCAQISSPPTLLALGLTGT